MEENKLKLNLNALKINGASPGVEGGEKREEVSGETPSFQAEKPVLPAEIILPPQSTDIVTSSQIQEDKKPSILGTGEITPTMPNIPLSDEKQENLGLSKNEESEEKRHSSQSPVVSNSIKGDELKEPLNPTTPIQKEEAGDSTPQKIKLPKINFQAMQKSREQDQVEKTKKNLQEIQDKIDSVPIVQEKSPELFNNYKPSFDGRAKKFFDHLKELRLKPRTRTSLISLLIFGTISFVGYLFYFHPEKHSLGIYKASIIHTFSKKDTPSGQEVILTSDQNTSIDNTNTGAITGSGEVTQQNPVNENIGNEPTNDVDPVEKLNEIRNKKIKQYFSK